MSVTDTTIFILIGTLINYLLVYSKNRLFGNIGFMLIGIGIMYKIPNDAWIGWIIFLGALGSLVYDILSKSKE